MATDYCRGVLRVCVAQLCQNLGWHNTQSTPLELLTNVLERYILELGKVSHRYSEQFGRTEPNLDDLALTFRHVGIQLGELEDYIRHIEPVPFSHDTISFPAPKQNNLQFPNSRSCEIQQHREEHIDSHLPYMYPGLEDEVEEEKPPATLPVPTVPSEATSPTISPPGSEKRSWPGSAEGALTKRSRLSAAALPEEAGPSQYEMMSVVMTQNGVLTPTRQGKLPDARTPPPGFRQAIQFYKENRKDDEKSDRKMDKSVDGEKHSDKKEGIEKCQRLFESPDRQVVRPLNKQEKTPDRHIKLEKSDQLSERTGVLKENIKRENLSNEEILNEEDASGNRNVHPKKKMLTKHFKKVAAAAEHAKKQGSPKLGKLSKSGKSKSPSRASAGIIKIKTKIKDKVKSNAVHDRESWLKDFFPSKPEETKEKPPSAPPPAPPPPPPPPPQVPPIVTSPNRQANAGITASQMKEALKESKKVKLFEKGAKGVPKTKIIVVHPKAPVSETPKISSGLDEDSGNSCDHSPERLVIAENDVKVKESQKARKARLAGIDESIDSVIRNSAALADEEARNACNVKDKILEISEKQPDVVKKKEKVKSKNSEKTKKKDKSGSSVKNYSSSDSIFASIDSVIRQSAEEIDVRATPVVVKEEIPSPLVTEPQPPPEPEPIREVNNAPSLLFPPVQLKTPKRSPGRPRKKPRGKAAAKAKDHIMRDIFKSQIQKKMSSDNHHAEVKPEPIVSPEISVYDFPESPGPPETKKPRIMSPKNTSTLKTPIADTVLPSFPTLPAVTVSHTVADSIAVSSHTGVEKEKKVKKDKDRKEKKEKDRSKDKEHRKEKKEKKRDKEKKKKNKDRERGKDKDRMKDDKFMDTFEALPGYVPKIKLNIKLGSAPSSSVAVSVSENKLMSPQHEVSVAGNSSSSSSSLIKPSRPEIPKLVIKPIRCESLDIRSPEPAPSPAAKSPTKVKSPARAKSPLKTRSPSPSPTRSPSQSRSPSPELQPLKSVTVERLPSPHVSPSSKATTPEKSPSPPPRSPTPDSSPARPQKSPTPSPKAPSQPSRSPSPEPVHSPIPSPSPPSPLSPPSPPSPLSPPSPPSPPSPQSPPSPERHNSPSPPPPPPQRTPTPPPRTPSPAPHSPLPRTPSPTPRTPSPTRTPSPHSPSSPADRSLPESPSNSKSTPSPTKSSRSSPKSSPVLASPPTPREAAKRAAEKVSASRSPATSKGSPGDMSRAVIVETVGTFVDASGQQIWICPACKMPDDGSPMIGCDGCDDWYHWPCVNITEEPPKEQDWFCPRCAAKSKAKGVKGRGRGKGRGRKKKV